MPDDLTPVVCYEIPAAPVLPEVVAPETEEGRALLRLLMDGRARAALAATRGHAERPEERERQVTNRLVHHLLLAVESGTGITDLAGLIARLAPIVTRPVAAHG